MINEIKEAADYLRQYGFGPTYGIILGTGLGALAKEIQVAHAIPYENIPHFPVSTVESHRGRLLLGSLEGKKVMVMQGRFHYYEGYTLQQVTFPVRVMAALGIRSLFISNACGALNPDIKKGELMVLNDHINLLPDNPLRGRNYLELGPRFPDMGHAYDRGLIDLAMEKSKDLGIKVHQGVYVVVAGPNLETSAEYRYLRIIGGDVVGMSTVPEAIVAVHMGLPVMAISVITDEGYLHPLPVVSVDDVISAASQAEPYMTTLIKRVIAAL
ncbi:MAG: purine-nucleoside phosphorylase [Bacteroidetes bacterium]|nr:purine-nucleoside phosphorylase [Bacteroidota bacterium]